MSSKRHWLLSCGHTVSMLEHERQDVLPSRPRMCARCGRLRDVEAPSASGAGELVCQECGACPERRRRRLAGGARPRRRRRRGARGAALSPVVLGARVCVLEPVKIL